MGITSSKCCCLCCVGTLTPYKKWDPEQDGESSCWPCAATGLYVGLPNHEDRDSLRQDAKILFDAMEGCGTKESEIIRIVTQRSPKQMQVIRQIFNQEFANGADGQGERTLESWLKGDLSGDFERLLLSFIRDRSEKDARFLHEAMDGLGTDDDELREILATRSAQHIKEIDKAYRRLYGKSLVEDVKDDTSFCYKQLLVALLGRADYLCKRLRDALTDIIDDDSRIIRILTHAPRDNGPYRTILGLFDDHLNDGFLQEIEYEATMPDLQEIKEVYQQKYGLELAEDIKNHQFMASFSHYQETLLQILKHPAETTADSFHEAITYAMGTNDDLLIELLTCRTNREIQKAAEFYQKKYGQSLIAAIKGDTSMQYQNLCVDLVKPRYEKLADTLHASMDQLGTEDDRMIGTMAGRTRFQLRQIAEIYERKQGKRLEDATDSETSFWYRRTLKYIIKQAEENLYGFHPSEIMRVRDM